MSAGSGRSGLSDEQLRQIFESAETIAVVGASVHEHKAANAIPRYLQEQGYRILPVNPRRSEVLGEPAYGSLADIRVPIDVVDVFRPASEAEEVARAAIASGAPVLWFQPGTQSRGAVRAAREAGLTVIDGLCMGTTHAALGLGRAGASRSGA